MQTLPPTPPGQHSVDTELLDRLAARAPSCPSDGRVIWARRHGQALGMLAEALRLRALPALGPVSYCDAGAFSPLRLVAATQQVGDVVAVAAWAHAYGAPMLVEDPFADQQSVVRHVSATVELGSWEPGAGDHRVLLRVWTAVRPPVRDPLVDLALDSATARPGRHAAAVAR